MTQATMKAVEEERRLEENKSRFKEKEIQIQRLQERVDLTRQYIALLKQLYVAKEKISSNEAKCVNLVNGLDVYANHQGYDWPLRRPIV